MRVLGIDPGNRITGYGIVERVDSRLVPVAYGIIKNADSAAPSSRFRKIYEAILKLEQQGRPAVASVSQQRSAVVARTP